MKCIFVTCGQKELGSCTLQAANFIPRDKLQPSERIISSLGASPLGMKSFFLQVLQFIPWDEMQPSGCKTQFFLQVDYEIPNAIILISPKIRQSAEFMFE